VNEIIPTADQWKLEDQACLQRYAASYGVVGTMATSGEIQIVEKPTLDRPPQEEESYPEEENDSDPQVWENANYFSIHYYRILAQLLSLLRMM
jgi:hypothetical protein